jgi:hypothetical protein
MKKLAAKPAWLMLLPARPGTCEECAVAHDPADPHNRDSLYYQYRFFAKFKRWPTWDDAMAHCSEDVKAIVRETVKEMNNT